MSSYVVTGGAGFIGSHVVVRLVDAGHNVLVLDNLSGPSARDRAGYLCDLPKVTLIEGDIRDAAICRQACRDADVVLHLASDPSVVRAIEDPVTVVQTNVNGTVNLLMAAVDSGSVRRFVFSSTCGIYGDSEESPKREESPANPLNPYATSKLAAEHYCRNFYTLHGLQTVALRYFNVYGDGQDPNSPYAAVIPIFMSAIVRSRPIVIYGDGEQLRDFVHVDDIVEANIKAATATADVGGRAVNIASGEGTSLNQLVKKLEDASGVRIGIEYGPARAGDIRDSRAYITAAARLLDYAPTVSLDTGLARTLHFYRSSLVAECK